MAAPSAAASEGHLPAGFVFNLGAIALAAALLGLALAYAIDAAGRQNRAANPAVDEGIALTRTLGGKDLAIPASWFRYSEQRVEGFAKQIDLELTLPLGPEAKPRGIEVTLLPRSRVRPSSSLLDGVYLHDFQPEQLSGPLGLVGKPLTAIEGFQNETVWYDALSPDPFVAKCSVPVAEGAPSRCVRTVYLGPGIAAVYAFDADVLDNWRQFDPQMKVQLSRIGVY